MEKLETEWEIDASVASPKRFKSYNKNHPREFESCFSNLEKIKFLLEKGLKLGEIKFGFFRSEGKGVYRLGQSGIISSKETRLYVYFDSTKKVIYLLDIGTKESQDKDINNSKELVKQIKENKQ